MHAVLYRPASRSSNGPPSTRAYSLNALPTNHAPHIALIRYHSLLMSHVLLIVLVRFLEGMFVIGVIGSFVVIVLTGIEDLKMLLGREEQSHS